MTPIDIEKTNRELLSRWRQKLGGEHSTAFLLMGIGHDQKSGQITLCFTEDTPDQMIVGAIRYLHEEFVLKGVRF